MKEIIERRSIRKYKEEAVKKTISKQLSRQVFWHLLQKIGSLGIYSVYKCGEG